MVCLVVKRHNNMQRGGDTTMAAINDDDDDGNNISAKWPSSTHKLFGLLETVVCVVYTYVYFLYNVVMRKAN